MNRTIGLSRSVRTRADAAVVVLAGEMDIAAAPVLETLLQEAAATGLPHVAVDLTAVSFWDCQGLGALVGLHEQLKERGATMSVEHPVPVVRRVLVVMGLTEFLSVMPEEDPAHRALDPLELVSQLPLLRGVVDAALSLVVTMSHAVVSGAHGVSITLPRDGRLGTVAASNDVVLQMDHDQYDTGQGPCLDAATIGLPFHSSSLADERRWPQFVPRARARGIRSIMSTPLLGAQEPLGALNIYSRAADAFAAHEQAWAAQFAEGAAEILTVASMGGSLADLQSELSIALESREQIGLAQGIVMARQGLSAAGAQRFLTDLSVRSSKPMLAICLQIVRSVRAPAGVLMTPPLDDSLDRARQDAGLSQNELWLRYFGLGGMSGAVELDAMCHGVMTPTGSDHDRIAHALNERFTELGRNHPVPYSDIADS